MNHSVICFTYPEGQRKSNSGMCFSHVNYYYNPKKGGINYDGKVEYVCRIDKSLKQEHVDFWIDFTSQCLNPKLFESQLDDKKWTFTICLSDFKNKSSWLLYLIWARYLEEFPEVVIETFNNKKDNVEDTFQELQNIHKRDLPKYKFNNSGHGLLPLGKNTMYYRRSKENISLNTFRDRLKTQNRESVHAYFVK